MTAATASARSRRRVLAGGFAAALVAATGLAAQPRGRRGGTLNAGLTPRGFEIALLGATGQTLTEISGDGSLIPALAEHWEASEAGRVWRFDMRAETAAAADLLGRFGAVQVRRATVTLRLDRPDPDLPLRLAAPDLTAPGAAGLYRVLRDDASGLHLVRIRPHWKETQAGWADALTLVRIDSPAARLAALRSGRVDVIDGLDGHARRLLAPRGDVRLSGDIAVSEKVGLPGVIGSLWPLDNGRMAERWWLA